MAEARVDGLAVRYEDAGNGEPAVLCLPGWCATRAAFDDFARRLAGRRRVLTPDWRGHGRSEAPAGDFGSAELLRDALAVIEASGASVIVPLATAHAGWVAIELRRRLGSERVPKLVLVDWIVSAPPPPFVDTLAALQDPTRWQGARDRLFDMWTEAVDHPGVVRFVREDMGAFGQDMWSRAAREIAASYQREGSPLAALERLDPPAPTLHLYAQPADPNYLQMQQAFAAGQPWFAVERVDARSHFPTLEVPAELADRVERFLA